MTIAHIRRFSPIWQLWTSHHRVGGVISSVSFGWAPGNNFRTGVLSPIEVERLSGHASVEFDTAIAAPGEAADGRVPDAPTIGAAGVVQAPANVREGPAAENAAGTETLPAAVIEPPAPAEAPGVIEPPPVIRRPLRR